MLPCFALCGRASQVQTGVMTGFSGTEKPLSEKMRRVGSYLISLTRGIRSGRGFFFRVFNLLRRAAYNQTYVPGRLMIPKMYRG